MEHNVNVEGNAQQNRQANRNEAIFNTSRNVTKLMKTCAFIEKKVKEQTISIKEIQQQLTQLKSLVKAKERANYSLKRAGRESELRVEVAKIYCESLTRQLNDDDYKQKISTVLKEEAKLKYKHVEAIKFCRTIVSQFKTEERRRVYGLKPTTETCRYPTRELAANLMKYYRAPDEVTEEYYKNLAMLRKYVRENPEAKIERNFFDHFQKWIEDQDCEPDWQEILLEDENHDYCEYPCDPMPGNGTTASPQRMHDPEDDNLDDSFSPPLI